jgi:hypothetical protein
MQIPNDLVFDGSKIEILLEEHAPVNRTTTAVVIEGTRPGFLSLSNCLIFLANSLEDPIWFSSLPFVTDGVGLRIEFDETIDEPDGVVVSTQDGHFVWKLSELNSNGIFCAIHSLANLNLDLHLDHNKTPIDLSVYCMVKD